MPETRFRHILSWLIGEGTVQIRKTDDTHGGFFSGAVYGIYDSGGTKVDELTTSATDYVKSKPLPLGHYYLQELKAPSGAILDTTKHEFDLTTNGATLSLSVSDQSQTANILITKQGEVLTGATQSDSRVAPSIRQPTASLPFPALFTIFTPMKILYLQAASSYIQKTSLSAL